MMDGAQKHDGEKWTRPELIAPEYLEGTGAALVFGAKKYAAGNWAKGMAWSRPYGALLRHLFAWARGEKYDPESGLPHLWHASCMLMFLVAYEARSLGTDDRAVVGLLPPDTPQWKITMTAPPENRPGLHGEYVKYDD